MEHCSDGLVLPPGVSLAMCMEICRQWGLPPGLLICSLEQSHSGHLGCPFTLQEWDSLYCVFNFAAELLQNFGDEIHPIGEQFLFFMRHGIWDYGKAYSVSKMVDQASIWVVNDLVLNQSWPIPGETMPQGAVGSRIVELW